MCRDKDERRIYREVREAEGKRTSKSKPKQESYANKRNK